MPEWEYEVRRPKRQPLMHDELSSELRKAGREGWELVSAQPSDTGIRWILIFKKPKA